MSAVPSTEHAIYTDALHRAHARSVFSYCVYRLRSREEAEDAVQMVFLNAQRSLERGVEPEFQRAWLLKIAERVVSNVQRASRRRARVEFPVDLDRIADAVAGTGRASSSSTQLIEAFSRISERQRRALVLCEIHGWSHAEASAELGISPNAVGALLTRGRRSLAAELSRSGTGPRVRISGCLSVLFDLKWLVGSVGAKLAAGGASLAILALVSHPGHMLGRATSPGVIHATASPVALREPVGLRRSQPGAALLRRSAPAHVVHKPWWSPAPVAGASPAEDAAGPDPGPAIVDTLAPPDADPQLPAEAPASAPADPSPAAPSTPVPTPDIPALQADGQPSAPDSSVVSGDAAPQRGMAGSDPGRSSTAGPQVHDSGPCADAPCAPDRAANADVAGAAQSDRALQAASDNRPPPPVTGP